MIIVETTGEWSLMLPNHAGTIHRLRPTVVTNSDFVQRQVAVKQCRILATDLPDEATDKEFVAFWIESGKDKELAIESFKASFLTEEPKTTRRKKPVA